ncbi:MAG: hypothetical protein M3342_21360 [Bacteroidota bacterium]|nr:hypothetical protein [Bacteroidota bacterium]
MVRRYRQVSISGIVISILVLINAIIIKAAFTEDEKFYWALLVSIPLLLIAIRDVLQKKHAIIRNFPLIGHLRYLFESIRPEIRQYFFESDLDGKPLQPAATFHCISAGKE